MTTLQSFFGLWISFFQKILAELDEIGPFVFSSSLLVTRFLHIKYFDNNFKNDICQSRCNVRMDFLDPFFLRGHIQTT